MVMHGKVAVRLTALALLLGLVSCMPQPLAAPRLRMYVLECGHTDLRNWPRFEAMFALRADEVASQQLANPCFLIVHGTRALLWDSGYSDSLSATPVAQTPGAPLTSMPVKLLDQLTAIGWQPNKIEFFAPSHFHADHVGNARLFIHSKVLVQRAEWEPAFGPPALRPRFAPYEDYAPLRKAHVVLLEGEFDVFGDGSVTIHAVPGHTAGSQVLLVRLQREGPVLLSGDLYHFREERLLQRVPNFDLWPERTRESRQRIEALAARSGAKLWIQHDPIEHSGRKIAPLYYD